MGISKIYFVVQNTDIGVTGIRFFIAQGTFAPVRAKDIFETL